jgi:hypothetical protein
MQHAARQCAATAAAAAAPCAARPCSIRPIGTTCHNHTELVRCVLSGKASGCGCCPAAAPHQCKLGPWHSQRRRPAPELLSPPAGPPGQTLCSCRRSRRLRTGPGTRRRHGQILRVVCIGARVSIWVCGGATGRWRSVRCDDAAGSCMVWCGWLVVVVVVVVMVRGMAATHASPMMQNQKLWCVSMSVPRCVSTICTVCRVLHCVHLWAHHSPVMSSLPRPLRRLQYGRSAPPGITSSLQPCCHCPARSSAVLIGLTLVSSLQHSWTCPRQDAWSL